MHTYWVAEVLLAGSLGNKINERNASGGAEVGLL